MKYGNRDYWGEVQALKKSLGEIPEQTCPDIDLIIKMLEELRADNTKLRDLGHDWYKLCEDIASEANELQDKCEELETQRDELYEENEALKLQLN